MKRVDDQQNRTRAYGANGYPAFLIIEVWVTLRNSVGIVENENGGLKTNVMLAEVLPVLFLIPFESHGGLRQRQRTD